VEVARITEPWSAADVAWSRQPRLSPTGLEALASTAPPRALRVDVTRIVERWQRGGPDEHGVAVVAGAGSGVGASYATGTAGGAPPRLEVYVR
jgi:hypothetical protein